MKLRPFAMVCLSVVLVALGIASARPTTAPALQDKPAEFVIRDVRVFDGERTIARANVHVRGGSIVSVGASVLSGIESIPGDGRTLLPGLIDAHTHTWGDALDRALLYGVTTELDMFTDHRFAAGMRAEQQKPGGATQRADLLSAGILVTAPKGHGTQYGMVIPTIAAAAEAQSFIDARIAEGSDYIKIVYSDGVAFPSIDRDVLKAVIDATKRRGKMAVVHIGTLQTAEDAIAAGASGLVHIFADAAGDAVFAKRVLNARAFVTPTLTVIESATGTSTGSSLLKDTRLAPFISASERVSLAASFPSQPKAKRDFSKALAATKLLFDAGVPILAGSDAPNPGTTHGASIHRELELLVRAGLPVEAALAAATSRPARAYGLKDRGRIAPGTRADLVLVAGNPTANITDTRDIVMVWKRGVRLDRRQAPAETVPPVTTTGIVSNFESAEVGAEFGSGWVISTDSRISGTSSATMTIVKGGANNSGGALEVAGTLVAGAPSLWAGAMFFPATTPMAPVNLSKFKELVFWARGDGGEHQVMVSAAARMAARRLARPLRPSGRAHDEERRRPRVPVHGRPRKDPDRAVSDSRAAQGRRHDLPIRVPSERRANRLLPHRLEERLQGGRLSGRVGPRHAPVGRSDVRARRRPALCGHVDCRAQDGVDPRLFYSLDRRTV